jgi:hypothetical protein
MHILRKIVVEMVAEVAEWVAEPLRWKRMMKMVTHHASHEPKSAPSLSLHLRRMNTLRGVHVSGILM